MKITYPIKNPHCLTREQTLATLQSDVVSGLASSEARKRNRDFGLNVYQTQKQKSAWKMILEQFQSPVVYLLISGAVVSLYFKSYIEALAILVVILVNACIGFIMEWQARNSMKALKEMDKSLSRVIRDGKTAEISSEQLCPGDILVLEAGDIISGDGRLMEVNQLQCDESSLTGESLPSVKDPAELAEKTPLGDQFNMVFKGSSVMNGTGKAIITGIAQNTQLGTITSLVESSKETKTPLDKKLNKLSKNLIWIMLVMTIIFAATGFIQGKEWHEILETSIALAVAAFPEGLPIVSTVALAYGMLLMAKKNAIVKKLSSVETLGSTNVILTDKTGTLTENKIYVESFAFPDETLEVRIEKNVLKFVNGEIEKNQGNFEKLKLAGALCNNATIDAKGKTKGDPIEIALIQLANASETHIEALKKGYKRIAEQVFSSETKVMGTLDESAKGRFTAAKGSVEHLLKMCKQIQRNEEISTLSKEDRKNILAISEKMAASGLRVIAFAFKEEKKINKETFMEDLVYIGMIGFLDPPRSDIKGAITTCREAGIRIVMITGDHPLTALNIARKTGLVDEEEKNVITGQDLPEGKISAEWKKKILSTAVFARTTPKQKLEIAEVYQNSGNIVAMTGDGVNDAPALKKADVGIAMGQRGTQVAKETASIILKNDSFASIAKAVSYGREIFQNIQKFVVYLISCNLSEILIVTALGFLAPASTLLALQILFLNMITDVFPALALGVGSGDKTVMKRPPRNPKDDIINKKDWLFITLYALAMTAAVVLAVIYGKRFMGADDRIANNIAFVTLAFAQLFHVFNMASKDSRLLINEITKNKFIWLALLICTGLLILVYVIPQTRSVLGLVILSPEQWYLCLLSSLIPLIIFQVYRLFLKLFSQT
ncbi:HAD-IC family P-type ATPase [Emticicia sp. CRIBPO]|uniref:cation-translocating P-type ATPase n=1 Tax=Emticicia sp. CRIBPO TaxID=2683258 RepID=UPI00141316A4|nr:cation-translocating P-type ATPase [Emticicia sp. CRIBPO]NBA88373.1 HAD-IC family P-type ATPase [Emticicia sp. CRIBPO]